MRWPLTATLLAAALVASATSASGTVTVEMSQTHYAPGESITLTITNHYAEQVYFNMDPPLRVVRCDTDSTVAPCLWWMWIVFFEPGESRDYTIEQYDCLNGTPAPFADGMYLTRIQYTVFELPYPQFEVTAPFCVGGDCAPTSTPASNTASWGQIKGAYR